MDEILGAAVVKVGEGALAKVGECLVDPVKEQVSNLCCYNSNAQTLIQEAENLEILTQTVQQRVDEAQRNLEDIRPDVADWLKRANETKTASGEVLKNAENYIKKGCRSKLCPFIHYSSSREAKKTTDAFVELQNNGKFDRVSVRANPENLPPIPATSPIVFESRDRIKKEIVDTLKDDSVYLIGLCGMGGVGKTTMAEKIMYEAKTKTMFEVVVWATVSQSHDLKKVQQQIAEVFGLKLDEESEKIRAGKLLARLTNAKSFLIILDDVWEELDLTKLGIPSQSTTERRKLIITSRDSDVLTNNSNICYHPKILPMEVLTEEEAWNLFQKKACVSDDAVHLHETAKEVAKECKGLPLALVVVGSALRYKNEHAWKDALRQLKRFTLHKDVYLRLSWSYDQLQDKDAKDIFLFCCLFPEDHHIDVETLVRYGWGLRIFSNIENLSEARDRVHTLIEMLKSRFLLIHVGDGRVKMHDVIRDMAISIASKDRHVFMVNDDRKEWPNKDSYTDYTHISVTLAKHSSLPQCIVCPILEFLRMEFNWRAKVEMSDNFFDSTRGLRVLEANNFGLLPSSTFGLLPSSMFGLTNLRALHLTHCDLEMPTLFGKLENLEILDLSYSRFNELPEEVGQLKKLKLLDLTDCPIREIAPGTISGLVKLEELLMCCSFDEWDDEEDGKERKKASLKEVASLEKLVTLEINIRNPKFVALVTQKLERYCLQIGKEWHIPLLLFRMEYNKAVYWTSSKESPFRNFYPDMTRNAERLQLEGDGCNVIIKDLIAAHSEVLNTNLKCLKLSEINDITGIFNCQIPKKNFSKLEELEVVSCYNLKNILAPPMFRGLTSLISLVLSQCERLEEVIAQGEAQERQKNVEETLFPHLTYLMLSHLPKMRRFCHMTNALKLPSLGTMIVQDCPMLESFSMGSNDSNTKFIFNKELLCTNLWWLELKNVNGATGLFENRISIGNFSRLEIVTIESCYGLKNLFSPPMSRGLVNLKMLKLQECVEVEEVIAVDSQEGQRTINKEILFPKLEELELKNLPKFYRFCHMTEDFDLTSLGVITIEDCPQIETFSLGSLHLPSLESVYGIKDAILATEFFFNKKREETHMDNGCIKLSVRDLPVFRWFDWEMYLKPDSSSSFLLVAKLDEAVEVKGRCPMANLSTADAYEILCVIMLEESADEWEDPVNFTLTLPEGITHDREENLKDKPGGQWLEILIGEFIVEPNQIGDFEFSLFMGSRRVLLVEGVIIRPKPNDGNARKKQRIR